MVYPQRVKIYLACAIPYQKWHWTVEPSVGKQVRERKTQSRENMLKLF